MPAMIGPPWVAAVLTALVAAIAVGTSLHALLTKREPRAAVLWVGLIWFVPVGGGVLYVLLGINRIRRTAKRVRPDARLRGREAPRPELAAGSASISEEERHLEEIRRVVDHLTPRRLLAGNAIEPLVDGEDAYPAMLAAIDGASRSVSLLTYLFDNDRWGRRFVTALAAAERRGAEVRVLVDDLGVRYSWPSIRRELAAAGLRYATFLPILNPRKMTFLNLRNHRKVLVVDGHTAFTGGMNIGLRHMVDEAGRNATRDIQFRVRGPVVTQLQSVFADDWSFATGEQLRGSDWFPKLSELGTVAARAITDGPDDELDNLRWTILAALTAARSRVCIVTPYFLPDATLIAAMNMAAMRGVEVDVVLPEKSNLPYVHWATFALLWQVLEHGCRVWLTPPPFDHSKLMLVDGCWALVGSTNWDPRALRLNFELNLECYDRGFAGLVGELCDARLQQARPLVKADVDRRSLPVRIRDGVARLFIPYL